MFTLVGLQNLGVFFSLTKHIWESTLYPSICNTHYYCVRLCPSFCSIILGWVMWVGVLKSSLFRPQSYQPLTTSIILGEQKPTFLPITESNLHYYTIIGYIYVRMYVCVYIRVYSDSTHILLYTHAYKSCNNVHCELVDTCRTCVLRVHTCSLRYTHTHTHTLYSTVT